MPIAWQVTIDCADPNRLVAFWCEALGYVPEPPPEGWTSWLDYWLAAGLPEEELEGADEGSGAIIDPDGRRPRIWFQQVPEPKSVKNRVHLDQAHARALHALCRAARPRGRRGRAPRGTGRRHRYTNAPRERTTTR